MIRVTIEMCPGGDVDKAYVLAQGVIINDCSGTQDTGHYHYGFTHQVKRPGVDPGIGYEGHISGFPRKRKNVLELLRRCLEDARP